MEPPTADAAGNLLVAAAGVGGQQDLRALELAGGAFALAQHRCELIAFGLAQFDHITYVHLSAGTKRHSITVMRAGQLIRAISVEIILNLLLDQLEAGNRLLQRLRVVDCPMDLGSGGAQLRRQAQHRKSQPAVAVERQLAGREVIDQPRDQFRRVLAARYGISPSATTIAGRSRGISRSQPRSVTDAPIRR